MKWVNIFVITEKCRRRNPAVEVSIAKQNKREVTIYIYIYTGVFFLVLS